MLKNGDVLKDRYKVASIIGEGGMSVVYLVEDLVLKSQWAMKETLDVFPDADKTDILDQFKREAEILANISHPNLPRVIDYFSHEHKHYLVEEYIEGASTEDIMELGGKYDEVRILKWAIQICDLLQFLHDNSIIYRDLKPGNILIDKDEKVYLVDFGIARFFQGGKAKDTVIIGTPGFASPEHYGRGETDRRSDIYSLGATLHYMITGVDPADKPFHFEIPYFVNPQASFETSSIVMKCLDMDPNRRFQNAADVQKAITEKALPKLKKRTAPLEPPRKLDNEKSFWRNTDFLGRTTKFLSYTSVFPASMGISGVFAMGLSILGPLPGLLGGIISFPVLCIEFWKRLDSVYKDQYSLINANPSGIAFRSKSINLVSPWREVIQLKVVKNTNPFALRKIKSISVKTRSGDFQFDSSFKGHRKLLDTIITQSGLTLSRDGKVVSIYTKP